MFKFMGKDVKTGAATSIHVASSPEGGKIIGEYWANSQVKKAREGIPFSFTLNDMFRYVIRSSMVFGDAEQYS